MDVGNITSLSTFKTGRAPEASGDIFAPRSAADGSGKPLPEVTASREASESRDDLGLAVSDIQSFVQSVKRNELQHRRLLWPGRGQGDRR